MKTKQINKLTMYFAVRGICDASPAVWQSLEAFADAYADFKTHVTNIQALSQNQSQDTSGIIWDKQAARITMCNAAFPVARAVHAYALKNRNNQLAVQVDFSMTELMGGRDVQSAERCQNIYAAANSNLASLSAYGITAVRLATLSAAISSYNVLISVPRDLRAKGKSLTGDIHAEFDDADDALTLMDDLLGQLGDATCASDYKNVRKIVDIAASHASPKPPTTPPSSQMRT
jgi:hypothetical protein